MCQLFDFGGYFLYIEIIQMVDMCKGRGVSIIYP